MISRKNQSGQKEDKVSAVALAVDIEVTQEERDVGTVHDRLSGAEGDR